jgi:hypothetical protein
MLIVPKGYLLLTTAVDQLAGARRLAGLTNDDAQNAARADLAAELHSGSILTKVISPSSGHTFAILSEHWALEIALTWLEQGECLLTEDFVDPWPLSMAPSAQSVGSPENIPPELAGPGRWPSLRRGERAPIFVSEHDCQRLMAQQATKQESFPSDPIADVEAREKDKGGRPPDYDWEQIKDYALTLVQKHGKPGKRNRRLPSKDQLVEAIIDKWASHYGIGLAKSTVRRYVNRWLSEILS